MKYTDIKSIVSLKVKEYMNRGETQEEAEAHVLRAGIAMMNEQKIGFIDLKFMFQILGYDFNGKLADDMAKAKKALRENYGLNEAIDFFKGQGFKEDMAVKAVIQSLFDSFNQGEIEGPELLDGLLWALGYRIKEQFFIDYYKGKKPKLAYEVDE